VKETQISLFAFATPDTGKEAVTRHATRGVNGSASSGAVLVSVRNCRNNRARAQHNARSCSPFSDRSHHGRIYFSVLHSPLFTHAPRQTQQNSPSPATTTTPFTFTLPRQHSERSTRRCVANVRQKMPYPKLPFWIPIHSAKASSCRCSPQNRRNQTRQSVKSRASGSRPEKFSRHTFLGRDTTCRSIAWCLSGVAALRTFPAYGEPFILFESSPPLMHIDVRLVFTVTSWSEVLRTSEALQTG